MRKFSNGDKVVVYATLMGAPVRSPGFVEGTVSANDRLLVRLKKTGKTIYAHPKQCRRLKKKELRRIWIPNDASWTFDYCSTMVSTKPPSISGEWVEFLEVKKK